MRTKKLIETFLYYCVLAALATIIIDQLTDFSISRKLIIPTALIIAGVMHALYVLAAGSKKKSEPDKQGEAFFYRLPPAKRAEFLLKWEELQVMKKMAENANIIVLESPFTSSLLGSFGNAGLSRLMILEFLPCFRELNPRR